MCLVNKLKARHAYHPAEVGQYSSRTDPKGAAWMHSVYIYPMGMPEGGLYTCFTHILTKTKPVDLQSYSLKETRSLKQGLSVKMPEGCCYTSVLRDQ